MAFWALIIVAGLVSAAHGGPAPGNGPAVPAVPG
jgi:hypothetical protein